MILTGNGLTVLDMKVRLDSVVFSLEVCNKEKTSKCNQPYFLDAFRKHYGTDSPSMI